MDIWAELAQPAEVAGLHLQSRYVMAPMTRSQCPGGVPTEEVAQYYARRADQLGMVITEGIYISDPSAGGSPDVPRFGAPEALAPWREVTGAVHDKGAKIFGQLWHIGCVRRAGAQPYPNAPVLTPSGLSMSGKQIGEPASLAQIEAVIAAFAESARQAKESGFDGVELHGAHGYLIDQFFWERTNRREDAYGGSLANRIRFAVEIVQAVRDAVGSEFPIQFRFSQWKGADYGAEIAKDEVELEMILTALGEAGVDIFHPSTRRFWLPAFEGSPLTLAGWTRRISSKPTIAVGHVGVGSAFGDDAPDAVPGADILARLYEDNEFDLLAIGRALLADPRWIEKTRLGQTNEIDSYQKESERVFY